MSEPKTFKVGEAPWETAAEAPPSGAPNAPQSFKVGEAPWEKEPESNITKTSSALRGAAQGATLGFADEMAGGAEALWEKAKGDPRAFGELYKQYRDESRKNFEAARAANPASYATGEIGAAIGTAFIPGMAVARGAKAAQVAAQAAALGGLGGIGYSNEESLGGMAKDGLSGAAVGGALGYAGAKVGQALSRAATPTQAAGSGAGPKLPGLVAKRNADEIRAAAKELGVELTDTQILDNAFMQKMDSLLQQSPTLVGQGRAAVVKKGVDAVEGVAEKALEGATTDTASQVGERVKGALASKIREEKAPISRLYERLKESTQNMELSPKSLEAVSKNIEKLREANLGTLKGMVRGVADDVRSLKTVDDVKFLRTQIRQGVSPTASPAERNAVGLLDRKLKALEESTVMRAAKNFAFQTKDKKAGEEILGLINERRVADKQYAKFMTKLEDFSGVIKGGKVGSPEGFVQKIENMGEEELTRRLFAKNNAKGLAFIKEHFPEEANQVFALEKQKLLQKFTKDGKVQANALLREVKKYSPEVQEMVFGKENVKKLKAASTYMESLPGKANPSETTTSAEILSFWGSPVKALGMTTRDLLIQGVLKSAGKMESGAVDKAMRAASTVAEGGRKSLRTLEPAARRSAYVGGNRGAERAPLVNPVRRPAEEENE